MKKSLSLVLAAVLAFGSAVSAFAALPANAGLAPLDTGAFFKWSSTAGKFVSSTTVAYGDTVGFLINDGGTTIVTTGGAVSTPDSNFAKTKDDIKNLKAYPEYKIPNSSTIVEKVAVEYKKYDRDGGTKAGYAYFVTMKLKSSTSASSTDLYGEMYLGTSKTSAVNAGNGIGFQFEVEFDDAAVAADSYTVTETNQVLDFEGKGDVDITFTTTNNSDMATYIVDATGQSKLNCGYTTKFNSEFAAKYPAANLEFLSFGAKPSFNRIGELTIYSEEGKYLYEITADGFKEPKYTYDEDYEAFVLKTRTLAAYVISDIELEAEVIEETPAPSVPGQNPPTGGTSDAPSNGGKPNPNTGR